MASKKSAAAFEVTLKAGHPTGTYRRGGHVFRSNPPTVLETVPDAVKQDPWLIVKVVDAPKKPEELKD